MLTHTGTVTATAGLNVRSTPNGAIIGKINVGDPIQGQGELVVAGSYTWMQLSSPMVGWVATAFLNYTSENVSDEETPAGKIYVSYTRDGIQYEYDLVEA